MVVFFYGLFMDIDLLKDKGVEPKNIKKGYLDGYQLFIGQRASLIPENGARSYGLLMTITNKEAAMLYAEESVTDYIPEKVEVSLPNDQKINAVCYNLPPNKLAGSNSAYVKCLLELVQSLDFPLEYQEQIALWIK